MEEKFCKYCGNKIPMDAVICTGCGRQVEELRNSRENIVINNQNINSNVAGAGYHRTPLNKWVAFLLCLFLGYIGAHKFYEGKVGMGLLYLFTGGLCGFMWIIDCIVLLLKPNPYYA